MDNYKEAINRFQALFAKALQSDMHEPTAMTLASVGPDGQPSARVVLLKGADDRGFVFYTNSNSVKGKQLEQNPKVALCFFWPALVTQVRIEGTAQLVSDEEADRYWESRPRESQIGAWASLQSQTLDQRRSLENRYSDYEKNFGNDVIPRPPHWTGYLVTPTLIEFWTAKPYRLHDRTVYEKTDGQWTMRMLYP